MKAELTHGKPFEWKLDVTALGDDEGQLWDWQERMDGKRFIIRCGGCEGERGQCGRKLIVTLFLMQRDSDETDAALAEQVMAEYRENPDAFPVLDTTGNVPTDLTSEPSITETEGQALIREIRAQSSGIQQQIDKLYRQMDALVCELRGLRLFNSEITDCDEIDENEECRSFVGNRPIRMGRR